MLFKYTNFTFIIVKILSKIYGMSKMSYFNPFIFRFSTIQDCHSHLSTLDLSAWKKTR